DKPVLNVFRLLAKLGAVRLGVTCDRAVDPVARGRADAATDPPAIAGIATMDETDSIQLFLASHHDDWAVTTPTQLTATLLGATPGRQYRIYRSLVAAGHANSYTAWDAMGRPQTPDAAQLAQLHQAAAVETTSLADATATADGLTVTVTLPSHSSCLLQFVPLA
ncbi:MAG: hypothetical protein KDD78_20230, partial [Caldilineaceae bacterium]|nr:hypothetical protein [Caldilineaceae bacterium]